MVSYRQRAAWGLLESATSEGWGEAGGRRGAVRTLLRTSQHLSFTSRPLCWMLSTLACSLYKTHVPDDEAAVGHHHCCPMRAVRDREQQMPAKPRPRW